MMDTNPLSDSHIKLSIHVFDTPQPALVRRNLTVQQLIDEILKEFAGDLDPNSRYVLLRDDHSLPDESTLNELDIQEDDELIFGYVQIKRGTSALEPEKLQTIMGTRPVLREVQTGKTFVIEKYPALIGRPRHSDPGGSQNLAVDLSQFPDAKSVSRPHAQITQSGREYAIESIKEGRSIMVNGIEYTTGRRATLVEGDLIDIGKIRLQFGLDEGR